MVKCSKRCAFRCNMSYCLFWSDFNDGLFPGHLSITYKYNVANFNQAVAIILYTISTVIYHTNNFRHSTTHIFFYLCVKDYLLILFPRHSTNLGITQQLRQMFVEARPLPVAHHNFIYFSSLYEHNTRSLDWNILPPFTNLWDLQRAWMLVNFIFCKFHWSLHLLINRTSSICLSLSPKTFCLNLAKYIYQCRRIIRLPASSCRLCQHINGVSFPLFYLSVALSVGIRTRKFVLRINEGY